MTEQEAINVLLENVPKCCKMVDGRYQGGFDDWDCDMGQAIRVAVLALQDVRNYQKIGTVEEIKDLLATISEAAEDVDESGISVGFVKDLIQLKKYREIGTVEECRKAVEKQKPKKPKLNYKPKFFGNATYTCPKCGNVCLEKYANERQNNRYCWDCGQAISWEEIEEE